MVDISDIDLSKYVQDGPRGINPKDDNLVAEVKQWMDYANSTITKQDHSDDAINAIVNYLNAHLTLRTFLVGHYLTVADFTVWKALRACPEFNDGSVTRFPKAVHALRWYHTVSKCVGETKDDGPDLPGALMGRVVTRFPPEPSGYLHIGHAKAAMMNAYFAKKFKGKLLLRMDDTNPSKEKADFFENIMHDLETLKIKPDMFSHTSDNFGRIEEACVWMIKNGKAYADDTDVDTMRKERNESVESKCRNNSVEESLKHWEEMRTGSDEGRRWCIRAKIDMTSENGTLRDPVMYRVNLTPHSVTKDKFKVYPTYDFACPLVDSWEGVTHALRTTEYHDRNAQYYWFLDAMGLRKPVIYDFSRLNMVYTACVDKGLVKGWDDPRFPTVQGIMRRGLTVEALYEFILLQGASKNINLMEWHGLWNINKRIIDPICPRYYALGEHIEMTVEGLPEEVRSVPKHRKNPEVGNKDIYVSPRIYIETADAKEMAVGEEVTLMNIGNVIVTSLDIATGKATATANLNGDVKKTKKKITWLAVHPENAVPVTIVEVDHILTKKKLEEEDDFEKFLNYDSWKETKVVCEKAMSCTTKGQHIQFVNPWVFIMIPEGKDEQ